MIASSHHPVPLLNESTSCNFIVTSINAYLRSALEMAACMGKVLVLVTLGSAPQCIRTSAASGSFFRQARKSGVSPFELGTLIIPDLS